VLLPAFIDAHIHLLSYAASLRAVDCTAASSIAEIQDAVRARASITAPGAWIRAIGYEETQLAEDRHPTRHDLDEAAPAHPVRLVHRSGHASVLNSLALRAVGITIATEEPPGGSMERDLDTGEPAGFLLGMEHLIDGVTPPLPYEELTSAVREATDRLLGAGVVCIQDATHTNGGGEWELFARLVEDGALDLDVVLMEGIEHLGEMPEQAANGRLRRGATKIMLHETETDFVPDETELHRLVAEAHGAGRQVAVHAVGEEAVGAASRAIEAALRSRTRPDCRHRIEHAGLLPGGLAPRLAELGITVVSQPALLHERGERYLRLMPEVRLERLYAYRTLAEAGVTLAASSDAPVTPPVPLASVAAAVARTARDGRPLGPAQAVGAEEALRWWTAGAAHAGFLEGERGVLREGLRADVVLLPPDALEGPQALAAARPARVWREGREIALASARTY
jgi:predicted amidohydrolase YtcJ